MTTFTTKSASMLSPLHYTEAGKIITPVKYLPEVVIILPFQPVLHAKSILEKGLKDAMEKVEAALLSAYSLQQAMPVIIKLNRVVNNINFHTHKKSIAVFISPVMEKVFYLNFEVEEKILVDDSFKLSHLALCKRDLKHFLLLFLQADVSKVYVGGPQGLHLTKVNTLLPGGEQKRLEAEARIESFIQHVDRGLTLLLRSHPYPIFVVGSDKLVTHFNSLSNNTDHILRCLLHTGEELTEADLHHLISPYLKNWSGIRQQSLIRILNEASRKQKLHTGIEKVYKAPKEKDSLLLFENGYEYNWLSLINYNTDFRYATPASTSFYIQDALDEIAEHVLEAGGDIDYVSINRLVSHQHIAYLTA